MYNRDDITILVRQSPAFEDVSPELMETIKSEFNRIFGEGTDGTTNDEKFLNTPVVVVPDATGEEPRKRGQGADAQ